MISMIMMIMALVSNLMPMLSMMMSKGTPWIERGVVSGFLVPLAVVVVAHHVHVVLVVKMNMMIVMTMVGIVKLISGWKYDK